MTYQILIAGSGFAGTWAALSAARAAAQPVGGHPLQGGRRRARRRGDGGIR